MISTMTSTGRWTSCTKRSARMKARCLRAERCVGFPPPSRRKVCLQTLCRRDDSGQDDGAEGPFSLVMHACVIKWWVMWISCEGRYQPHVESFFHESRKHRTFVAARGKHKTCACFHNSFGAWGGHGGSRATSCAFEPFEKRYVIHPDSRVDLGSSHHFMDAQWQRDEPCITES